MRCERARELFSDYCEGSIQGALRVPLEQHLNTCSACSDEVAGLRMVWGLLDSMPSVEPPADFRETVWRRIGAYEAEHVRRGLLVGWDLRALLRRPALGWAAAALLIVALAGVAIPGRYSAAGFHFPWSLFRPAPAAEVTAGAPRQALDSAGRPVLEIPVYAEGAPTQVRAQVVSGPMVLVAPGPVEVRPGQPAAVRLRLTEAAEPAAGVIRLTWTRAGAPASREVVIPAAR